LETFHLKNVLRLVQLQHLGYGEHNQYRRDVEDVVNNASYSEWLLLYYMAQESILQMSISAGTFSDEFLPDHNICLQFLTKTTETNN
jgi:hypothetical protein